MNLAKTKNKQTQEKCTGEVYIFLLRNWYAKENKQIDFEMRKQKTQALRRI